MELQYSKGPVSFHFTGDCIFQAASNDEVNSERIILGNVAGSKLSVIKLGSWGLEKKGDRIRARQLSSGATTELLTVLPIRITSSHIEVSYRSADGDEQKTEFPGGNSVIVIDPERSRISTYDIQNACREQEQISLSLQEIENLKKENESLNKILSKKLDEEIDVLKSESISLDKELSKKIKEYDRQIKIKTENNQKLKEKEEQYKKQVEYLTTDCDAITKKLEEQKLRLNLDQEAIKFIEDSPRVEKGTLSSSLHAIEKELGSLEDRMAHIVKFQQKFNALVEKTIKTGGGYLTIEEEGGSYGNTERAE